MVGGFNPAAAIAFNTGSPGSPAAICNGASILRFISGINRVAGGGVYAAMPGFGKYVGWLAKKTAIANGARTTISVVK